jgi:predicted TIM-barrel fold metal-dependent hydrolase
VRAVLEAEIAAGQGRFRGVRNTSAWHADPAARGSSILPPRGLLADLAAAFPETTIVLNHVGGAIGTGPYAGRSDEVSAAWSAEMRTLARHPNIHVKVGGLGMRLFGFRVHEGALPPSSERLTEAWRPYVETRVAAFGAGRCMFESNFPADKGTCGYAALWNAFKRITAGWPAADRTALFSGTAGRVYRLERSG